MTLTKLVERLATYLESDAITEVERAYHYARDKHEGQFRRTGDPYITHPTAVAYILADMHMDHQTLMAALLHDVIEDTGVGKRTLRTHFGPEVADLVDGVSKLTTIFQSRAEAQAENFQKMAMAMARDIRVILVKLADRLHNMRTIGALGHEKRRRIARETLDFYAPIASRLGMNNLRIEFEDLGFAAFYPMRAERIARAVKAARRNRSEIVEEIGEALRTCLAREGIEATVTGREKHLFSIYRKMKSKRKSFSEIMDVFAFRIVVDRADTCYRVLGAVHGLYKPVANRFKDYIAIPKVNGYQSLHTTLFGMHGVPIEIQIRTHQMDAVANNGIAGHWLYKSDDEKTASSHARAREWVKGLLEMQQRAGNSMEFIENMKIDLFPDEVYVFTPKGRILELPQGASPVDFAYAVHTDVGNTCVACRVDRRLAPLSAALQSGQTVEIITSEDARPNPDWLSFVVTGKARSSIRHALKTQKVSESRALGRRLLNRSLANADSSLKEVAPERLAAVLEELGFRKLEALLEDIGLGNRMAYAVARKLTSSEGGEDEDRLSVQQGGPLAIRGTEGLVVAYGKCCHPLPGDPIVGHLSSGRGLVVHVENCRNLAELRDKRDEIVPVRWAEAVQGEFSAELRLEVEPNKGVIAEIAAAITTADASIEKINTVERNARLSTVIIGLGVRDRVHLASIMRRLRRSTSVISLTRSRNT
ncbi:MAG TPA: bifunctional GTP diphosphokinase/guanosine-3',5'-bis pyrophosphate 3'-pyrophosphohydrolase [Pseudomonadales bacterium]|nr:bifunctional GTP diphosphokinase/guanosine-3',5'-bis pyrophosphate 3'-pyrophosphohydrolase [Pseudomonadales bacterium]